MLALQAFKHRQHTEFLKTKAIVEAIAYAGTDKITKVNETMTALLGMLIPEVDLEKDRKTKKMMGKLQKLDKMGPIAIRPMDERGFRNARPSRRAKEE